MKRKSLAWVLVGGAAFGLAAMDLAACSSTSTGTGLPSGATETDGATGKDGSSATGEGGTTKTDGGGGSTDAGKECGTPDELRPRNKDDAGNPFKNFLCPFSAPAGQKWDYCDSGTHCCVPPANAGLESTCEATCPTAADGGPFDGRDIECLDPIDCSGGKICCGIGQMLQDPVCLNRFGKGFRGTKCAASCDDSAGEFTLCQQASHCSGGKTCEPGSASGADFGVCL